MNVKEAALFAALERHLPSPEWALLAQVGNGTGYSKTPRYIDALALNLWPSRGMELWALEMKTSKADLRRELANPPKAEAIAAYCDRFFIVTDSPKVVDGMMLPPTWGWLCLRENGQMGTKRPAAKLDAKPLDREFVAAVLRRISEQKTGRAELRREHDRGFLEGKEAGIAEAERQRKYATGDLEQLRSRVQEFEAAAGITIDCWTAGDIGAAVRRVRAGADGVVSQRLQGIRRNLESLITTLDELLEEAR
jgi:hypothetical protein